MTNRLLQHYRAPPPGNPAPTESYGPRGSINGGRVCLHLELILKLLFESEVVWVLLRAKSCKKKLTAVWSKDYFKGFWKEENPIRLFVGDYPK